MNVENSDEKSGIPSEKLRKLSDYETVTSKILSWVARDTRFKARPSLDRIFSEHPRLVVVFSHSSPLSWIPAPCLLTAHAVARGGGARRPIAVMDRFFYSVPILKQIATYISQSSKPLSFPELVHHFENLRTADLVVFPEGSNCFFGDPSELQPFRSLRFIEIAVRTKTPMLICVHRGSEEWGRTVALPEAILSLASKGRFFGRLLESGRVTIPLLLKPVPHFQMLCELYEPSLQILPDDPEMARAALQAECEKIQAKMKAMLQEVDDDMADLI